MEGGSRIFEFITYGMVAFVVLAMIALLIRTFTLVIGFLSLNFAESLQRWLPARRWLERRLAAEQDEQQRRRHGGRDEGHDDHHRE